MQTDRNAYYFCTATSRDSVWLTFINGTDTLVSSWFPDLLELKNDTGWIHYTMPDGRFQDPTVKPQSVVLRKWFTVDSVRGYPEGKYRLRVDGWQTGAAGGRPFLIYTNDFQLRHRH